MDAVSTSADSASAAATGTGGDTGGWRSGVLWGGDTLRLSGLALSMLLLGLGGLVGLRIRRGRAGARADGGAAVLTS
jgi:hypothetical protein